MKKIILYICLIAFTPANFALANCCPADASSNSLDICIVSDNEGNLVCEDRYYKNGNLKAEIYYKEKQIEGVARGYYENGKLEKELTYANGKKNGIARTYYENGQLKDELSFVNDQLEGVQKSYYQNGNLHKERNFKNGIIEGEGKVYYENGNLKLKCFFKNGEPYLCKTYEINGNLKSECSSFKNGKPDISCKFKWALKKLFK